MTTMQAVQISKFGGPDVLQTADVPVPVPGPDQVLVKLDVAGVNYSDTNWRDGLQGGAPPMINGAEGAGIVAGSVPRCAAFAKVIGSPIGIQQSGLMPLMLSVLFELFSTR